MEYDELEFLNEHEFLRQEFECLIYNLPLVWLFM